MANDKEFSSNDEVKRSKETQSRIDVSEKVISIIKELLDTTTDSVCKEAGYTRNEKYAGVYGDGTKYGAGVEQNQFNIKIAGKTKTSLQKEFILGTKNVVSVINFIFNDGMVTIEYKSPENAFFRGVDTNGKTFMVNEKISLPTTSLDKLKTELKKLFTNCSQKELGYLANTKLGIDDRTEKSTASVVEHFTKDLNMKKLSIKDLISEDDDNLNSDKVKDANSLDLKDIKPSIPNSDGKKLYFDEDSLEGEEIAEDDSKKVDEITTTGPVISGSPGGFKDGANSGSGGYNTPYAWKKTNYAKNQEAKKNRPTITKEYKIIPKDNLLEGENSDKKKEWQKPWEKKSEDKEKINNDTTSVEKKSNSTPDAASKKSKAKLPDASVVYVDAKIQDVEPDNESNGVVEPGDGNSFKLNTGNETWKNANQTNAPISDHDNFWQEVKLEPGTGYIPMGMKRNYIAGMHDASKSDLKKAGYSENEEKTGDLLKENANTDNKPKSKSVDLTRKKFFNEAENKAQGVNKRYLITEKTTEEYEKERWKRLSSFKLNETIKEAEEMTDLFDTLKNNKTDFTYASFAKKAIEENTSHDDIFDNNDNKTLINENAKHDEETVTVEKPNSKFGIQYTFFKKDFLNESAIFILDLTSRVYVANPNFKKR